MNTQDLIDLISVAGFVIVLILVFGGDTIIAIIREIKKKNNDC